MKLFEFVGNRIRELRLGYGEGEGLSQEALARAVGVTANTISRWETATYHPKLDDLEKLARALGVSILEFFPPEKEAAADDPVAALLRTAKQLAPEDLQELHRYAEFRRARHLYNRKNRPQAGRKGKDVT